MNVACTEPTSPKRQASVGAFTKCSPWIVSNLSIIQWRLFGVPVPSHFIKIAGVNVIADIPLRIECVKRCSDRAPDRTVAASAACEPHAYDLYNVLTVIKYVDSCKSYTENSSIIYWAM